MFGLGKSIAAQDPSYPVYVDTSVMMGNTGLHNGKGFDNIEYMVCTPENNFFPDLANVSAGWCHYCRCWIGAGHQWALVGLRLLQAGTRAAGLGACVCWQLPRTHQHILH